jgi:hypothetical protein
MAGGIIAIGDDFHVKPTPKKERGCSWRPLFRSMSLIEDSLQSVAIADKPNTSTARLGRK